MEVVFAGDEDLHHFGDLVLAVTSEERLSIPFELTDVMKAVDLMQWCSVAIRRYDGIWAYIYVRGSHMGYIWTQRYTLELEIATNES